jgi:Flp pilus assembly protein TadB
MLTKIKAYAILVGGAFVVFLAALAGIKRNERKAEERGKELAEEAARRLDHENAAAIRDRARAARSVQPKDKDTRGYRD